MTLPEAPPEVVAAVSQAASSVGHAVEVLDEADVSGNIRDDLALIAERLAALLGDWQ
jgi:hypothetical protein